MPRFLLTSGQVSILVSSGIVVLFTTALFLSGYAIQQRTLKQLRLAIKAPARPSPKIYLPDRFKSATTELEDGTVVIIESEAEREAREIRQLIEVRPTLPDEPTERLPASDAETPREPRQKLSEDSPEKPKQDSLKSQRQSLADVPQPPAGKESSPQKVLQRPSTEVDEDTSLRSGRDQKHPDPSAPDQRQISRAERRRLIKEELRRLSHLGEPVYYQRRLW